MISCPKIKDWSQSQREKSLKLVQHRQFNFQDGQKTGKSRVLIGTADLIEQIAELLGFFFGYIAHDFRNNIYFLLNAFQQ